MDQDSHIRVKKRQYLKDRLELWILVTSYYKSFRKEVNDPRLMPLALVGNKESVYKIRNENTK